MASRNPVLIILHSKRERNGRKLPPRDVAGYVSAGGGEIVVPAETLQAMSLRDTIT